jgi:membrane protease YdiL (CAAX protease family)
VSFFLVFFAVYLVIYQSASMAALIEKSPLLLTLFLPGILSQVLIPSLGEEPGWRGFALPRMQARYGPLAASIVLGALHGLWHLPVMFTFALGPFSATTLITFVLTAVGGTVIYTWIVNHARGSILIAMLIHAASNSASQFLSQLLPADTPRSALAQVLGDSWIVTLAFALAALLLVTATRGRLGYRPASTAPEA